MVKWSFKMIVLVLPFFLNEKNIGKFSQWTVFQFPLQNKEQLPLKVYADLQIGFCFQLH